MSLLIKYSGPAGSYILPSGYTRLAYIESTGTLWVDTGYVFTKTNKTVQLNFALTGTVSSTHLYGASNTSNSDYVLNPHSSNTVFTTYVKTSGVLNHTFPIGNKILLIETIKDTTLTSRANGEVKTANITKTAATQSMYLFHCHTGGSGYNPCKMKVYSFRMWDEDTLVRDFVPVQKSDGTIGLLDLVNNTFYGNSGTGTFIAGPICPQGFPTGEYCLVEWLEGTGTLWINTGYLCNKDNVPNLKYRLDAMARSTAVGNRWWANGIGGGSGITFHVGIGNGSSSTYPFTYGDGVTDRISSVNGSLDTRYIWELDVPNTKYIVKNEAGTALVNITSMKLTPTLQQNLTLFRWYSYSGGGQIFGARIYRAELWNGSTKVVDLVPCYRRSDMKPGMYDIIRREFYTNQGTGEFLLGPSITFGWGEVRNDSEVGSQAHEMLGTQYIASNKFTHTGSGKDSNITLPVYLRVEPGQLISISFDTDVTQWASSHDTSGGITNKGKWSMWIYFNKIYNPNNYNYDNPICYPASKVKSLGGTRWKYSFTVPADMHMIRIRTNLYSDGSTSYTGHFWNFNWSFGDTGCQVNSFHAIPHNISTGDGRNGEKNGSFTNGYIETSGLEFLKTSNFTITGWFYPTINDSPGKSALLSLGNIANGAVILETTRYFSYDSANTGYPDIPLNTWTHIALVRDGDTLKYYKNGVYKNSISCTNMVDTHRLRIGGRIDSGTASCRFLDIQVWNEAITNITTIM